MKEKYEECRECEYWSYDYGCMNGNVCVIEDYDDRADKAYDKYVDDKLLSYMYEAGEDEQFLNALSTGRQL